MIFIRFGKIILSNFLIGIPLLLMFFFIPLLIIDYFFTGNKFILIATFILQLIFTNYLFLITYYTIKKKKFVVSKITKFEDLHIEPHPYLPFIYKENFNIKNEAVIKSELNNVSYVTPKLKTNNFRFINGITGGREIKMPKPKDLIRINCLGASTTGNYIVRDGQNYSYPIRLEKLFKDNLDINIEVNNCGQGGYNSLDIMVRFLIQIIDTEPDAIILYHGYNDIRSYLTKNYKSDYSNSKKNLSSEYWKIKIYLKIFKYFRISFIYFLLNKWFFFNIKNSLLDIVTSEEINLNIDYEKGLNNYKRNIENLILVCKNKNIDIYLSTFCFYLHHNLKKDEFAKKYEIIVKRENQIIKELSKKYNLPLIDNANMIKKNSNNFIDTVHFTPEGMDNLAINFFETIKKKYK